MSSDYSPIYENAHPLAKHLMKDDFFFDVIEETAPFGSDDGADAYAAFKKWRKINASENPIYFLHKQIDYWGYPQFDIYETNIERLMPYLIQSELGSSFMTGIDAAIVAVAFGQLYLEETIDNDIKEVAKTSIKRELLPEILKLWGDYENKRKTNLSKLLTVLYQIE